MSKAETFLKMEVRKLWNKKAPDLAVSEKSIDCIVELIMERWDIEDLKKAKKITFEINEDEDEEEDEDEKYDIWAYYGKCDISFYLRTGECYGSGGWL